MTLCLYCSENYKQNFSSGFLKPNVLKDKFLVLQMNYYYCDYCDYYYFTISLENILLKYNLFLP
jgi:hypothetical protein